MIFSGVTPKPRLARFSISAQVFMTRPDELTTDWLKLNPFKLNAIVEIPSDVNQIHTTGQIQTIKRDALNLLNETYWKIHSQWFHGLTTTKREYHVISQLLLQDLLIDRLGNTPKPHLSDDHAGF